jgi:hypothetical protein
MNDWSRVEAFRILIAYLARETGLDTFTIYVVLLEFIQGGKE